MASLFEIDLTVLKGVGTKRVQLFHKLGVFTVGALLRYYPRDYEDWSSPVPISAAPLGETCVVRASVLRTPSEQRIRKGMTVYKVPVTDGVSDLLLTYFNNPYLKDSLKEGQQYLFRGKMSGTLLHREMTVPEFVPARKYTPVTPIYPLTDGLSNKMVISAVQQAFQMLPDQIRDPIPESLQLQYGVCSLREALEKIHFPNTLEEVAPARKRLAFEELLVLQLALSRIKKHVRAENTQKISQDFSEEFFSALPFSPTDAQRRAVAEAIADMMGNAPMRRLVQGDVGSGKTAVAAALCYTAVKNGMQAAMMAPTEILARQHFLSLSGLLGPMGIRTALLTGSLSPKKKELLRESLATGKIDFIIGTHALLSANVEFQNLGLVVTDEQHRFGVEQRSALSSKGLHPHTLVMSATPIPRTLALMIYGDLDLSVLNELPPGRQKIDTFVIDSGKRQRAMNFVRQHLDAGRQCYFICPLISESENDMASVSEYAQLLERHWLPGYSVGVLHGRMKSAEKEKVMGDFADGKISALVSTTVVEVGVDVPNATIMFIENAERYGLSQLHQLRGRVGRGTEKSFCILVSDSRNGETLSRLRIMAKTSDGFQLAEEDLRLRGPGDFFGMRQHGLPALKVANLITDMELAKEAQKAAQQILSQDPELDQPIYRSLRGEIHRLFSQVTETGLN